ncbi:amino acid adenylation domain-containing protein [Actinacidiphila acidipaludis]|uniref:Amino acid adenylation domain-containing protein n=1 Tax=Actinacidiphila acidipaludis TaxID=2873382 RepID=A0ABS7QAS3_9ACTN|nr:amino acid adenylation domain-containing protein [Streptomyces acidipaludis]MBY8880280.1 amino acid adenylation domain-containing protein [Streptomyces acidipaludis]
MPTTKRGRETTMHDRGPASLSFLHSGFRRSVRRHPHRAALSLGERVWSYAELDHLARRWAGALLTADARPRRVGVLGHRGIVTYAGFLAALYAGAAAVPLNSSYPVRRNRDIVTRADLDALLTDEPSLPHAHLLLDDLPGAPPVLVAQPDGRTRGLPTGPGAGGTEPVVEAAPLPEPLLPEPGDTAYLLFTSGSTGRPKGVPITHANVSAFLRVSTERYGFSPDDRFSNTFDHTFDLAVFDLFMAWGSGGVLVPLDAADLHAPLSFIRDRRITVWFSVPSVAVLQHGGGALTPGILPSLRWSLFCGEALPVSAAAAWQAAAPRSVVENLYGPTEATIACTAHRWHPRHSPALGTNGIVPIGRPHPGMDAALLAADGTPVAGGRTGEICLRGPQVFAGYWRSPQQTQAAFHLRDDGRWYRTGDLGRRTADGTLLYAGRVDAQVKILGHRVELGEVEAHLRRYKGVDQAVVLAVPGEVEGTTVLAAVLCGPDADVPAVEDHLRERLPPYMIPLTFHLVDRLPLNANGKTDRAALRAQVIAGQLEPFPL